MSRPDETAPHPIAKWVDAMKAVEAAMEVLAAANERVAEAVAAVAGLADGFYVVQGDIVDRAVVKVTNGYPAECLGVEWTDSAERVRVRAMRRAVPSGAERNGAA